MTARGTPSRFLQSVLQNGVGRYVCQLKRMSLIFSKKGQGSLGVRFWGVLGPLTYTKTLENWHTCWNLRPLGRRRGWDPGVSQGLYGAPWKTVRKQMDFIEEGVVDFAKNNPGTVVYISPQSCRIPKIVAEYLNGNVKEETVTNKTSQEIAELITKLSNQSGLDIIRIRKPFHTDSPSIQGQWHPFTNRTPSIDPVASQAK